MTEASTYRTGEPYCGNCGHCLTGCVDSSKCPECGRPLVEVVTRAGRWGRRYRSEATLFGLPILDIALGATPNEQIGRARGIIAIGDRAVGLVAMGGIARGVVAVGGMAMGLFAIGGLSLGLVTAFGGLAVGLLADGGLAVGGLAAGGLAVGFMAEGGLALGYYALGGAPFGVHVAGPGVNSPEAMAMARRFSWFFGPPSFNAWSMVQPALAVCGLTAMAAGLVGLLAVFGLARSGR